MIERFDTLAAVMLGELAAELVTRAARVVNDHHTEVAVLERFTGTDGRVWEVELGLKPLDLPPPAMRALTGPKGVPC